MLVLVYSAVLTLRSQSQDNNFMGFAYSSHKAQGDQQKIERLLCPPRSFFPGAQFGPVVSPVVARHSDGASAGGRGCTGASTGISLCSCSAMDGAATVAATAPRRVGGVGTGQLATRSCTQLVRSEASYALDIDRRCIDVEACARLHPCSSPACLLEGMGFAGHDVKTVPESEGKGYEACNPNGWAARSVWLLGSCDEVHNVYK